MKTHIDKLRNPNYLGSWDLMDDNGKTHNRIVTIKEVKSEMVFDQRKQQEEGVLTVFLEECKPFILNATNRDTLKKVTETVFIEEMVGKKIELTTRKVKAFGKMHDAIRIVDGQPKEKTKTVNAAEAVEKLNKSTTLAELKTNWGALTLEEKKETTVISAKETLKAKLK